MFDSFSDPVGPTARTITESARNSASRRVRDMEVQQLQSTGWRVRDRRLPDNDARSLLGFIDRTPTGQYELLRFDHGSSQALFDSFDEALSHLTAEPGVPRVE